MGSSKKKKESDRKKHRRDRKDNDSSKKLRDKSKKRRGEDDDELLDYALHDAVQVQQNVYDYGHGFLSKGEALILKIMAMEGRRLTCLRSIIISYHFVIWFTII